MLRQGVGAEERRWTQPLCLQCPLLVVKVIKYWFGEMSKYFASHFAVQKHGVVPPRTPQTGPAVSTSSFICVFFGFSNYPPQKPQHFTASETLENVWQRFVSSFNAHGFASRFIFGLP